MFISLSAISGLCVSISIEVYAQLLNDRDNDGIEDNSDLCPDYPQNSCDGGTAIPSFHAPMEHSLLIVQIRHKDRMTV